MKSTPIRHLVRKTKQIDPKTLGHDPFVYVDISSIDRETKRIINPQILSVDEAPSRARKQIQANDVLVSTVRPNLNSVALVPKEYDNEIGSTGFCVLRADNNLLCPSYLFYFTQTETFVSRLTRLSIGAGYPAVTDDNILDTMIPLPSLGEQKRIAAILGKADRLRRLRRYARELSDGYLQSVFLEMFGHTFDGGTSDIPLVPLEQICTKITDGTHHTPKYQQTGVPFLSVKNVTKEIGSLDFSDVRYISEEEHWELSKRCKVEKNDILYTKVGVTYGIPQIVDTDTEFSIFVSLALLKPNKSLVMPKYLEAVLRSNFAKSQADRLVSGIGVPDLHLREIKTIVVPLPPLSLQQKFAQIVQKYERLRTQQREAERQAEHLFQALLQRAFRGELGNLLGKNADAWN